MSDLKAKMYQIQFRLGLRPRPRRGELTALPQTPDPLWINGPTSKGRGLDGMRKGRGREGTGRGGERREETEREGRRRRPRPLHAP